MGTAYLPGSLGRLAYQVFEKFVPLSEYMFFLDASPEVLLDRFKKRDEKEMFENLDEILKVRKKALALVKDWNIIDTSGSVSDTFYSIEKVLKKLEK